MSELNLPIWQKDYELREILGAVTSRHTHIIEKLQEFHTCTCHNSCELMKIIALSMIWFHNSLGLIAFSIYFIKPLENQFVTCHFRNIGHLNAGIHRNLSIKQPQWFDHVYRNGPSLQKPFQTQHKLPYMENWGKSVVISGRYNTNITKHLFLCRCGFVV